MNTVPTYRRGRQHFEPGQKKESLCDKIVRVIFTSLLLAIPPIALYSSESHRFHAYSSLLEVINRQDIIELGVPVPRVPSTASKRQQDTWIPKIGNAVHGTSSSTAAGSSGSFHNTNIHATTRDPEMEIIIPNSLILSRNTEYCQWEELRQQSCQTCTRRKTDSRTGEITKEEYDCNCTTTFHYIKRWKSYRINSFLFDQPAAHHNPQRDPFPSKKFVSQDAQLSFLNHLEDDDEAAKGNTIQARLSPTMLQNGIRGAKSHIVKWVRDGIPPTTSSWFRWIPDRTQYENLSDLKYHTKSHAATNERFLYVGDGYFFSPYEASRSTHMLKYFMQYLEGSLFDWQIGDLMPSCEAGDIRIRYSVEKSRDLSILGQVSKSNIQQQSHSTRTPSKQIVQIEIQPITTSNGYSVGLVHDGIHSIQDMIIAEDNASMIWATFFRVLFGLWAVGVSRFIGSNVFGVDIAQAKLPTQIAITFTLWFVALGWIWIYLWGVQVDAISSLVASSLLAFFVYQHPPSNENARLKMKID